jgi:hypothetical protein
MAAAFLRALLRWAAAPPSTKIVIPTGDGDESRTPPAHARRGVSAAKIIHHLEIKPTPATGEPAINVARKRRRLFDDKT